MTYSRAGESRHGAVAGLLRDVFVVEDEVRSAAGGKAIGDEGYVFDPDRVLRLKRALDLTLERLRVETSDHDVRKRLARTLMKIAKRRTEEASPEDLSRAVVNQACVESAPRDASAWLTTVRGTAAPTAVPWRRVQVFRDKLPC